MRNVPKHVVDKDWLKACVESKYREIEEKWELELPESLRHNELSISISRVENSLNGHSFIFKNFDQSMDESLILSNSTIVDPNDQKKFAITQELFETEQNYVTILENIMKIFHAPLSSHQQPDDFPNEIELKTIFGYLKPIISVHQKVIYELRPVVQNWKADNEVGSIFEKHVSFLLLFF